TSPVMVSASPAKTSGRRLPPRPATRGPVHSASPTSSGRARHAPGAAGAPAWRAPARGPPPPPQRPHRGGASGDRDPDQDRRIPGRGRGDEIGEVAGAGDRDAGEHRPQQQEPP